jgi:hypothetical protein
VLQGDDVTGVSLNRARTALSGFLHRKEITYKLENEWTEPSGTSTSSVKEAYLDWGFHNTDAYSMAVRVGQLKTRFGKGWSTDYDQLEFVDRGLATTTFSGVRTRAAMLHGAAQNSQLNWSVTMQNGDMAGAANNSGEEGDPRPVPNDDTDNELNWTFDVHWTSNPKAVRMGSAEGNLDDEKGFGAGVAYFIGNGRVGGVDTETTSGNVWAEFKAGNGIAANAEYFMRDEEQTGTADFSATGYQAAVSWTQRKITEQPQWGVGLRYNFVEADTGGAALHLTGGRLAGMPGFEGSDIDLVLNMYCHEHKLKSQLGLSHQHTKAPGNIDDYIVSLQTTFVF